MSGFIEQIVNKRYMGKKSQLYHIDVVCWELKVVDSAVYWFLVPAHLDEDGLDAGRRHN